MAVFLGSTAQRLRLARLLAIQRLRSSRQAFARASSALSPFRGLRVERLLLVPHDLRTCDPTVAADIYAGYFAFAGRLVTTHGRSPFEVNAPSSAWLETLCGFGWLRHLAAADTALAQANARALVEDFLNSGLQRRYPGNAPRVIARRLISFLTQARLLLDGAEHEFYRLALRALTRDASELVRLAPTLIGEERALAGIALAYLGLCTENGEAWLRQAHRVLPGALDLLILPDGAPATRNPRLLVDLICDLLPLRQAYVSRSVEPPSAMQGALDRMMPMLRLFRHGDGTLGLFNGMGLSQADLVATLLAYDDSRGQPVLHAPHGGYERMEAGTALVLMDTGAALPAALSREAHAGALSFEFSVGSRRMIVNCGAPRGVAEAARQASRMTAAHSTLTIDDQSSAVFGGGDENQPPMVIEGPFGEPAERHPHADGGVRVSASHDGYRKRFGLTHHRTLVLDGDGTRLSGEDRLDGVSQPHAKTATLRFHLDPSVKASRIGNGRAIMLVLPGEEAWQFESNAPELMLEESIYFAAPDGARKSEQIVASFAAEAGVRLVWSLTRLGRIDPRKARREPNPGEEDLLV